MGFKYFNSVDCVDPTLRTLDDAPTLVDAKCAARRTPTGILRLATHGDRERYVIEGEIARGGQAKVIRAHDRRLRRPVAIKQLIGRRKSSVNRFVSEALITARLAHPFIVPIYDIGTWEDGTPYFAMKLVEGRTLAESLSECRTERARHALLSVALEVVSAVAYAHTEGVIHRDLKPANILISDFGETIVIDWGIAKLLDDEPAPKGPLAVGTQPMAHRGVLGTPGFMAPEQALGEETDERSDVYSLGAILYTILAGRTPFYGLSQQQIIQRIYHAEPTPRLGEMAANVDPDLAAIVDRAMSRSKNARFATAGEMRVALRSVASEPSWQQVA